MWLLQLCWECPDIFAEISRIEEEGHDRGPRLPIEIRRCFIARFTGP